MELVFEFILQYLFIVFCQYAIYFINMTTMFTDQFQGDVFADRHTH